MGRSRGGAVVGQDEAVYAQVPWWTPRTRGLVRAGRRLTADLRRWPDFIVIGAQRAGTTSLYDWLVEHPRIAPALVKEVHYFDTRYNASERWYRSNFPLRRLGRMTGEASPYMLFHPLAPERAARDLPPTTRFIVLLREPVQRAISAYWLHRRQGTEPKSFPEAIAAEDDRLAGQDERVRRGEPSKQHQLFSYVARGRYAEQLERWFSHVDRERLLVLTSEDLFSSPVTSHEILAWLGLPGFDRPFPQSNAAPRHEDTDPDVIAALRHRFEPDNRRLEELLGRELWRL
jgi:hypothetical protein